MNSKVSHSNNEFAFRFFHSTLRLGTADENVLISPLSLYLSLGMLYNGAAGDTKTMLSKAMILKGVSDQQLNETCEELLHAAGLRDKDVHLSIANGIWYSSQLHAPHPAFLDVNRQYYNGAVDALDFSEPSAAKRINDWVSEKTNGMINTIVSRTNATDLIYLVNALYFKGEWRKRFPDWRSWPGEFKRSDGSKSEVMYMCNTSDLGYWKGPTFTMVELPYGKENAYSMYVLLPEAEVSAGKAALDLEWEDVQKGIAKLKDTHIELQMPRWEYAYTIEDMSPQLSTLGMSELFSNPDLTAMYPAEQPVLISRSLHKTYIKVGELGTEAAAVTAMAVAAGAMMKPPPQVWLNRPFLYFIVDKNAEMLIFAGSVADPSRQ